jgi:DNA-binding MarR family transcriptional regulator
LLESDYPRVLAERIGFLLARAHLIAREKADAALNRSGTSMKAFAALATLVSDGPMSQQRLSRRIRMDPATMVDVIDGLERSGHIVRRRNPDDRREYALEPTAKGRALLARSRRALEAAERETVSGLSARETGLLLGLLARIASPSRSSKLATDAEVKRALGR